MARYLGVDLGTKAGWAIGSVGHVVSGVWDLKQGRYDGGGMRFVKFRARLNELHAAYGITHVFFEEVRRHRGVDAAHVYGGLLAVLSSWCEENSIPYSGIPVGQIKKKWTGSGNASKDMMIEEARRRGFEPIDDNEADALAIFHHAVSEYESTLMEKEAADYE